MEAPSQTQDVRSLRFRRPGPWPRPPGRSEDGDDGQHDAEVASGRDDHERVEDLVVPEHARERIWPPDRVHDGAEAVGDPPGREEPHRARTEPPASAGITGRITQPSST